MKRTNKILAIFISLLMIFVSFACVTVNADTFVSDDVFKIRLESNTEAMIAEYYGTDTTMVIPEVVLNKTIIGIIPSAFEGDSLVEHVELPPTLTTIGSYAFAESTALKDFTITSSINKLVMFAFSEASALEKVVFEEGALTTIPRNCFYKCTALSDIQISSNITTIEKYAFAGCTSLKSIYIPSTVTSIDKTSFSLNPQLTIQCKADSYAEQYCIDNNLAYELVEDEVPVDKTELSNTIATADEILANIDCYKPESVENLQTVYDMSVEVFNNEKATEEEVANAVMALKEEIEKAEKYTLGDIDLNGTINIKDATRLQMYVAKYSLLNNAQLSVADVDDDGIISITDATTIQMIVTKLL